MKKLFLGGTCGSSKWREELIKDLDGNRIKVFNPVVENWDEAAQERELKERENTDFCLYVITPEMKGVYSIAEVAEDSVRRPKKTLFCYLRKNESGRFSEEQIYSLSAVGDMVKRNGGKVFLSLEGVADYLNNHPSVLSVPIVKVAINTQMDYGK